MMSLFLKLTSPACRTFFSRSVLLEKFGYSVEDASYILSRLNDLNQLSGNLIGLGNKKKLETYTKQNGQFNDLQDLLQVHGMGAKSIKRMCDKLLTVRGTPQNVESVDKGANKRFRLPILTPSISESLASTIKTVGSINVSSNEITWAKINCISKNLEVWESIDLESFSLAKKLDLLSVIVMCKSVVEKLPVCDTYVLEDLSTSGFNSGSSVGVPRNMITSILATLVHQPSSGGVPKVVLVGGRAVAKWSGRLIGSEKVSSQSIIKDIIVNLKNDVAGASTVDRSSLPLLYAEPTLRNSYTSSQPAIRESMADALLLSLAFIDLAINRRDAIDQPHR